MEPTRLLPGDSPSPGRSLESFPGHLANILTNRLREASRVFGAPLARFIEASVVLGRLRSLAPEAVGGRSCLRAALSSAGGDLGHGTLDSSDEEHG